MVRAISESGETVFVDVVTTFLDEKERWGHKRNPLYFPHDRSWFGLIPKDKRIEHGIRLRFEG